MELLRLVALDEEDLAVISTHLQDSEILAVEMAYLPRERRFALIADRFDWCAAQKGETRRCRTGLHFEGVTAVRRSRLDRSLSCSRKGTLANYMQPLNESTVVGFRPIER